VASATTCERCGGDGKVPESPCKVCKGEGIIRQDKTLEIKIPAGIDNGQRIRMNGEGEKGYRGSAAGDLYLLIRVKPHREFRRDGVNLYKEVPVSFTEAALGTTAKVETLDGTIELKIPSGTQSGKVFKVGGKGVPYIDSSKRGDLLITVRVVTPNKLTKKETELLKELAKLQGESVKIDKGLWESIKHKFE
jgi:molecular chaperone DnaJ